MPDVLNLIIVGQNGAARVLGRGEGGAVLSGLEGARRAAHHGLRAVLQRAVQAGARGQQTLRRFIMRVVLLSFAFFCSCPCVCSCSWSCCPCSCSCSGPSMFLFSFLLLVLCAVVRVVTATPHPVREKAQRKLRVDGGSGRGGRRRGGRCAWLQGARTSCRWTLMSSIR
eukprot:2111357-Rhodomonas_salina.1